VGSSHNALAVVPATNRGDCHGQIAVTATAVAPPVSPDSIVFFRGFSIFTQFCLFCAMNLSLKGLFWLQEGELSITILESFKQKLH